MADIISKEHRSWNMSRIRSQNTKPEKLVRKYLFRKGFRYRINVKKLPGKPDIVLKKYKTIIFVNGCFWHRHPYCKRSSVPKTNTDMWIKKFERNVRNDNRNYKLLESKGWNIIVIWECEIKENYEITMQRLINELEDNYIEEIKFKK